MASLCVFLSIHFERGSHITQEDFKYPYIAEDGHELLSNCPAFISRVLGFHECTTMHGLCSIRDLTQDFMHARQAIYTRSHIPGQ